MPKKKTEEKDPRAALFEAMTGRWEGKTTLWMRPEDPVVEGTISGKTELAVGGGSLLHTYRAKSGKQGHRGIMLIGEDIDNGRLAGSWSDTSHTSGKIMSLATEEHKIENGFSLIGSWAFGDIHWRWRITHQLLKKSRLEIRHYLIKADGQESLALLIDYKRRKD